MGSPREQLSTWLAEGDAPEADWGGRVLQLAMRGDLGSVDDILLDLPALGQPFACRSKTCSAVDRPPRTRSCCADIAVQLAPWEQDAIRRAMPEIGAFLAPRDGRWEDAVPEPFVGASLTRPQGRCVFSWRHAGGLRCGLHTLEDQTGRPRGTLKPMPCRLFPLLWIDLGDGRTLLSAVAKGTARKAGLGSATAFPCLRGDAGYDPLVSSMADTLRELFGDSVARGISSAVHRWRREA